MVIDIMENKNDQFLIKAAPWDDSIFVFNSVLK